MEAPRLYPTRAWKRFGHRCSCCGKTILRGTLLFLSAHEDWFCSRVCAAAHVLTEVPATVGV